MNSVMNTNGLEPTKVRTRVKVVSAQLYARVKDRLDHNYTTHEICAEFAVSETTVSRVRKTASYEDFREFTRANNSHATPATPTMVVSPAPHQAPLQLLPSVAPVAHESVPDHGEQILAAINHTNKLLNEVVLALYQLLGVTRQVWGTGGDDAQSD